MKFPQQTDFAFTKQKFIFNLGEVSSTPAQNSPEVQPNRETVASLQSLMEQITSETASLGPETSFKNAKSLKEIETTEAVLETESPNLTIADLPNSIALKTALIEQEQKEEQLAKQAQNLTTENLFASLLSGSRDRGLNEPYFG